jgi:GTP-binding protein
LKVHDAEFVTSAAGPAGIPRDGAPQIALVGRSNVGKSSLINALAGRRIARTSAAPGKTRLANIYRVTVSGTPPRRLYLVDLPGYGYARGGEAARAEFARIVQGYFRPSARPSAGPAGASEGRTADDRRAALLVVDARHPGLDSDLAAWEWLGRLDRPFGLVATKIDKLSRAGRARAMAAIEHAFGTAVLAVSAMDGEGMDDLWKLIVRLASSRQ